ncbi:MAG TPA: hypothetical protein VJM11_02550 [Nevskiaceae bacterium]|nr:hypothetical protein [Nevskiaceae bacterium]
MISYDIAAQNAQGTGTSLADSPSVPRPAVPIVVGSAVVLVDARDARELIGRNIESFGRIAPFTAG